MNHQELQSNEEEKKSFFEINNSLIFFFDGIYSLLLAVDWL